MKNLFSLAICLTMSLLFSSCFEILEEVNMNSDGSGDVVLTVNLSESKETLKNYVEMDSYQGLEVPKMKEIEEELDRVKSILSTQKGISNVVMNKDYENFIFKISGDFTDVKSLNAAINNLADKLNRSPFPTLKEDNFGFVSNKFSRYFKYPIVTEDFDKLDFTAKYILDTARFRGIYRFDKPVSKFTNSKAKLSPSKKAVMINSTLGEIARGTTSLSNEVSF